MKATSLASLKPLKNTEFWLLAIASGLIAVHLSLSWRLNLNLSELSMSVLCWGAVLSLLSDKRHTLKLESDFFSSLLGLLLIAFVLLRSLFITGIDPIFDFSPFIAALGLAMLASGVKGLRQYWLELIVIFAFSVPIEVLLEGTDISTLTAKFANVILSYLGFEVSRQGVNIILPTGAVEVNRACSGFESILRLLRLSVLFLVMFPISSAKRILVPIVAVLVAFVVNGVRVALMAFLVAYSSQEAFEYWHKGDGAQIFFLISTIIFGLFCYFVSKKDDSDNHEPMEFSGS